MSGDQLVLIVVCAGAAISAWQIGKRGILIVFVIGIGWGFAIGYLVAQWPLRAGLFF
jgi:hypothetical protein